MDRSEFEEWVAYMQIRNKERSETRKICLLGDVAVGKTRIVQRYAWRTRPRLRFNTPNLRIDNRFLQVANGDSRQLLLWEIADAVPCSGECSPYLQGTHGFVLVADGTRAGTVHYALGQWHRAKAALGEIPAVMLINKWDLAERWTMSAQFIEKVGRYLPVYTTSARTGESVDTAFAHIAETA
jgi:GTPase SAR1 family protein